MAESILRRLARDQWVRAHGTPRVTVLVGGQHARELWNRWLALSEVTGTLFDGDFDREIRTAIARAASAPTRPIAVLTSPSALAAWQAAHRDDPRSDRVIAMVDEGRLVVQPPSDSTSATSLMNLDARSVAEATLFEALEATPATAGRFALNESLSVRFGANAAEVDLLSRRDRIAIEIDGIHHFADPDCYRRDRRKDLLMQAQGLLVVRLLAEDVMRDVRDAVRVVCEALAIRIAGT